MFPGLIRISRENVSFSMWASLVVWRPWSSLPQDESVSETVRFPSAKIDSYKCTLVEKKPTSREASSQNKISRMENLWSGGMLHA